MLLYSSSAFYVCVEQMEGLGEEFCTSKAVVWRLLLRLAVSTLSIRQLFQMLKIFHIPLQIKLFSGDFAKHLCRNIKPYILTDVSKTINQICEHVSQSSFVYKN